jgi:hypothetical protein
MADAHDRDDDGSRDRGPGWRGESSNDGGQVGNPDIPRLEGRSERGHSAGERVAGETGGELGDAAGNDERRESVAAMHGEGIEVEAGGSGGYVADAATARSRGVSESGRRQHAADTDRESAELADAELQSVRAQQFDDAGEWQGSAAPDRSVPGNAGPNLPLFAPGPGATAEWERILREFPYLAPAISEEEIEQLICNLDDGLAAVLGGSRTDQLRACGNGVVALQAAVAITILSRRFQ